MLAPENITMRELSEMEEITKKQFTNFDAIIESIMVKILDMADVISS